MSKDAKTHSAKVSKQQTTPTGRIALREEGEFWNAYYALPDTMEDAILIGSIRLAIVAKRPELGRQFTGLMRSVLDAFFEDILGKKAEWPNPEGVEAPERERIKE